MRKLLTILTLFALIGLTAACDEVTPEKAAKTINAIYLDIKTIVTDPEVRAPISDEDMFNLQSAERKYLIAAEKYKLYGGAEHIDTIMLCADTFLSVFVEDKLDERQQQRLAAVRVAIKVLKNHLPLE